MANRSHSITDVMEDEEEEGSGPSAAAATSSDKPKCNVCGRSYSTKRSLTRHMKTHKEGKQFQCSICHKKFARDDNLRRHQKIHGQGVHQPTRRQDLPAPPTVVNPTRVRRATTVAATAAQRMAIQKVSIAFNGTYVQILRSFIVLSPCFRYM